MSEIRTQLCFWHLVNRDRAGAGVGQTSPPNPFPLREGGERRVSALESNGRLRTLTARCPFPLWEGVASEASGLGHISTRPLWARAARTRLRGCLHFGGLCPEVGRTAQARATFNSGHSSLNLAAIRC